MPRKPFPFEQLKKYTAGEAELINRVARCFPSCNMESPVMKTLSGALQKYLGADFTLRYESIFEAVFKQFVSGLPSPFVCPVVSLTPLPKKAIIELDPELVAAMVDKLLGGPGEASKMIHPLTPLEEGILQFLIVKILGELSGLIPASLYKLRLDQIVSRTTILSLIEDEQTPMVLLTFRVNLNRTAGYIRIGIPHSLLTEILLKSESLQGEDAAFFDRRLKDFAHFRTTLWIEAGCVALSTGEISALERGDIILFDEAWPEFDGVSLSGGIRLKAGEGRHGGMDARLVQDKGSYKVKIERFFNE